MINLGLIYWVIVEESFLNLYKLKCFFDFVGMNLSWKLGWVYIVKLMLVENFKF